MVKEVAVGAPEISQRSRYSTLPQRPWLLVCWALFARGVTSCITECFNGVLLKYYYFRTCYFFNFYAFFLCVIGVVFIFNMNTKDVFFICNKLWYLYFVCVIEDKLKHMGVTFGNQIKFTYNIVFIIEWRKIYRWTQANIRP